ncbi:MAG: hypothetical protein ACFFC7_00170 [Candidatus Hermodarchaeota archaeon]
MIQRSIEWTERQLSWSDGRRFELGEKIAEILFIICAIIILLMFFFQAVFFTGFEVLQGVNPAGWQIAGYDLGYLGYAFTYNLTLILVLIYFLLRLRYSVSRYLLVFFILIMIFVFLTPWRYFIFSGDLTLGVIDSTTAALNGINPYLVPVSRHASVEGGFRYALYPFPPMDVLSYGAFYLLLNILSFGLIAQSDPIWYLIANIFFSLVAGIFIYHSIEGYTLDKILFWLALILPFIYNNSILAFMYFSVAIYFFQTRDDMTGYAGSLFFLALSALSKYYAVLLFFPFLVQKIREKDWISALVTFLVPAITALIVCLPFGLWNVIKSTLLFYGTAERALDGTMRGSLLVEVAIFLGLTDFLLPLTLASFAIVFGIATFILRDNNTRLLFVATASLFILSGIEVCFLPFLALLAVILNRVYVGEYSLIKLGYGKPKTLFEFLPEDYEPPRWLSKLLFWTLLGEKHRKKKFNEKSMNV